MSKRKRIALILVSAGFTAAGLLVCVFDPEARFMGAFTALFFGSCLLVFVAPIFDRRREGRKHMIVSHRGERTEALVFPVSRANTRVMGIAAALWAIVGAGLLVHPSTWTEQSETAVFVRLVGAALVLLFGGGALLLLVQERRGGGYVALLPDGILSKAGLGQSFVPWDAIDSVGILTISDNPMVAIHTSDPSAVEIPARSRVVSRLNRSLVDADVLYANLTAPEEELQAAIVDRLEHPEKRARPDEP